MSCRIDHITITSPTLAAGGDLVERALGVRPPAGGQHPRMGTHNLLLRLGDALFLEVIAVDPAAPAPRRPRWFALDTVPPDSEPRLACWVARTEDIHAELTRSTEALGTAQLLSRGTLEWLISIPDDGSLPMGGSAPALIQWHTPTHPAAGMPDLGCRLVAFELSHPDLARLQSLCDSLALSEPGVSITLKKAAAPGLKAFIATPRGLRSLGA